MLQKWVRWMLVFVPAVILFSLAMYELHLVDKLENALVAPVYHVGLPTVSRWV